MRTIRPEQAKDAAKIRFSRAFANRTLLMACLVLLSLVVWPSAAHAKRKRFDHSLVVKAKQGDADAEFHIAATLEKRGRYIKAERWYLMSAQNGNPSAMTILGSHYEQGLHEHKSYAQALKWYEKAADEGNLLAMTSAGKLHERGAHKDYAKAEAWYLKAEAAGDPQADVNLAALYETHLKDPAKAVEIYRKEAANGDTRAQYLLGLHALDGTGMEPSLQAALGWFSAAALHGDADAQFMLGQLYEDGPPSQRAGAKDDPRPADTKEGEAEGKSTTPSDFATNPETAMSWFRLAAEQENPRAQARLALLYESGQGVARDKDEAYFWITLALDYSDTEDGAALVPDRDRIAAGLAEPELEQVQTRAMDWMNTHPPKARK
jgi:TPR repeat protein